MQSSVYGLRWPPFTKELNHKAGKMVLSTQRQSLQREQKGRRASARGQPSLLMTTAWTTLRSYGNVFLLPLLDVADQTLNSSFPVRSQVLKLASDRQDTGIHGIFK